MKPSYVSLPQIPKSMLSLTANPSQIRRAQNGALHRIMLDTLNKEIYKHVQQAAPRTVLFVGCGDGDLAAYLTVQNPTLLVVGIDECQVAIVRAQQRFYEYAEFECGDMTKLSFLDDTFDLVIINRVVKSLAPSLLREAKRIARQHVLIAAGHKPYLNWFARITHSLDPSTVLHFSQLWTSATFREFVFKHFSEVKFRRSLMYHLALCALPTTNGSPTAARAHEKQAPLINSRGFSKDLPQKPADRIASVSDPLSTYGGFTLFGTLQEGIPALSKTGYLVYVLHEDEVVFTQIEWVETGDVEALSKDQRLYELSRNAICSVIHRIDGGDYAPGATYLEQLPEHTYNWRCRKQANADIDVLEDSIARDTAYKFLAS